MPQGVRLLFFPPSNGKGHAKLSKQARIVARDVEFLHLN